MGSIRAAQSHIFFLHSGRGKQISFVVLKQQPQTHEGTVSTLVFCQVIGFFPDMFPWVISEQHSIIFFFLHSGREKQISFIVSKHQQQTHEGTVLTLVFSQMMENYVQFISLYIFLWIISEVHGLHNIYLFHTGNPFTHSLSENEFCTLQD